MQTSIHSSSLQTAGMQIDPHSLAASVALFPLDYSSYGRVLGHYRFTDQTVGSTWGAGEIITAVQWMEERSYFVLLRLRIGTFCTLAFPGLVIDPMNAFSVRNWPDAGIPQSGIIGSDARMVLSKVTVFGPLSIAGVVDAQPFGMSGAISATVLGNGTPMQDMFTPSTNGGHPMVYGANEGYTVQFGSRAMGGGAIAFAIEQEWAEVDLY